MITDIEEIKKPAFEQNIIDFVKDLLFGKEYTTLIDVENAAVLLRRKYHINPSKVQINNVYQALFKDNIISNTVKEYFKAFNIELLYKVLHCLTDQNCNFSFINSRRNIEYKNCTTSCWATCII